MKFREPKGDFVKEKVVHICWGDQFKDFLYKNGVREENLFVNGNLQYQLYKEPYNRVYDSKEILAQKYSLVHLSTGDILRNEIDKASSTGLKAQTYMNAGNLVPDEVLLEMMDSTLSGLKNQGVILDGFPRTIPQAEGLSKIFESLNQAIDGIINIEVDKNVLINRLVERSKKSGRADDTEEVIINRQNVYFKLTAPLIEFYKENLISIDGDGSIEEVTERILKRIQ